VAERTDSPAVALDEEYYDSGPDPAGRNTISLRPMKDGTWLLVEHVYEAGTRGYGRRDLASTWRAVIPAGRVTTQSQARELLDRCVVGGIRQGLDFAGWSAIAVTERRR
jgi:hypothetical protein